ncbi:MAG: hypothetical protein NTV23_10280 [Propionibacteriales bacterium]|nr:hypothetical protein [Propionibacteriales bacterium]
MSDPASTSADTWADRAGDRSFEMIWAFWGALGWALIGAVVGAIIGALPTGLPFTTWLVGCAGIGFLGWYAVALLLGVAAMAGWAWELALVLARWVRRRARHT